MVRRERGEREFSVPDNHGNQVAATLPTCGNSPTAIYFLFDTTYFRRISLLVFSTDALNRVARRIPASFPALKHRNQSSKPLRQTNKTAG
jgi:hypothetical protein